jgi:KDO2-lipid IV(A) lauroyltransferase
MILHHILAWPLWAIGPRKDVIRENLKRAYPAETAEMAKERERLEYAAYEHLVGLSFEIAMLFVPGRFLLKWIRNRMKVDGFENWEKAHAQGKGVLFLSSHVGNWELMAAAGGAHSIDLLLVTKKLKPEWFHQSIEEGRGRCGVRATYEPRTMRDVLLHLAQGKTVGVVLDQYTGPPVGVRVPLFGIPVGTHQVLAVLAKRTGAPVVPVLNYRLADGRQYFRVEPSLAWIEHENPNEELALNTAQYVQTVERHIREAPEQWLWIHRRFKGDLGPLRAEEWREGRARR